MSCTYARAYVLCLQAHTCRRTQLVYIHVYGRTVLHAWCLHAYAYAFTGQYIALQQFTAHKPHFYIALVQRDITWIFRIKCGKPSTVGSWLVRWFTIFVKFSTNNSGLSETAVMVHYCVKLFFFAYFFKTFFSPPPARWGLSDFMSVARLLLLPSSFLLPSSSFLLPPHRTSSASSWSQWASPDLNRRESERCGPRRTSTSEIRSTVEYWWILWNTVGLAGPQPARFCAPWVSPDVNRTSTARNKAT